MDFFQKLQCTILCRVFSVLLFFLHIFFKRYDLAVSNVLNVTGGKKLYLSLRGESFRSSVPLRSQCTTGCFFFLTVVSPSREQNARPGG